MITDRPQADEDIAVELLVEAGACSPSSLDLNTTIGRSRS